MVVNCLLCQESIESDHQAVSTGVLGHDGIGYFAKVHRECQLRDVMGGIGHLIAHEYWCTQKGDPDAGLTYRQSALLCDAYVSIIGVHNL